MPFKMPVDSDGIKYLGNLDSNSVATVPTENWVMVNGIYQRAPVASDGTPQVQLTGSNVALENKFDTDIGQIVVATSESFWSRLASEGRFKGQMWDKQAFSANTSWNWNWGHSCDPGFKYYIKKVLLSADVDCELGFKIDPGIKGMDTTYTQMSAYVKAGTPLLFEFDGEYSFNEIGGIWAGVNNAVAAGNLYASIVGIEVTANA